MDNRYHKYRYCAVIFSTFYVLVNAENNGTKRNFWYWFQTL